MPTTMRRRLPNGAVFISITRLASSIDTAHSWFLRGDELLRHLIRLAHEHIGRQRSLDRAACREDLLLALERVDIGGFERNRIEFGPMRGIDARIARRQI